MKSKFLMLAARLLATAPVFGTGLFGGPPEPGSAREKQQLDEYILEPRWIRLGLDTALAQKLTGVVLVRFRDLAKSFPPDPRPRR